MTHILTVFYFILFTGVCLTGAYVIYHILRYSLSSRQAAVTAVVFGSILVFLLVANAILFFRIDWDATLTNDGAFASFSSFGRSSSGY